MFAATYSLFVLPVSFSFQPGSNRVLPLDPATLPTGCRRTLRHVVNHSTYLTGEGFTLAKATPEPQSPCNTAAHGNNMSCCTVYFVSPFLLLHLSCVFTCCALSHQMSHGLGLSARINRHLTLRFLFACCPPLPAATSVELCE